MAKPIKETPVLYDWDAYRFEMAARNVVPHPKEEKERILAVFEEVKQHCAFSLWNISSEDFSQHTTPSTPRSTVEIQIWTSFYYQLLPRLPTQRFTKKKGWLSHTLWKIMTHTKSWLILAFYMTKSSGILPIPVFGISCLEKSPMRNEGLLTLP